MTAHFTLVLAAMAVATGCQPAQEASSPFHLVSTFGGEVNHGQYFCHVKLRPGVSRERLQREIGTWLDNVDETSGAGLERVCPGLPDLRARDFWALVLADLEHYTLVLNTHDSTNERDSKIEAYLRWRTRQTPVRQVPTR
jgi:hypothetical protein